MLYFIIISALALAAVLVYGQCRVMRAKEEQLRTTSIFNRASARARLADAGLSE